MQSSFTWNRAIIVWVMVSLGACASTNDIKPTGPAADTRLQEISQGAQALLEARSLVAWQRWALGEDKAVANVYGNADALLDDETLNYLADAGGDGSQVHRHLFGLLLSERVAKEQAELLDAIHHARLEASAQVDGEPIPLQKLKALIGAEPDRDARKTLAAKVSQLQRELNPLYERLWQERRQAAQTLGFENYKALSNAIRFFDVESSRALAQTILRDSQPLYLQALQEVAPRYLGLDADEVRHYDIPYLLRSKPFDGFFEAQTLLQSVRKTLSAMGVNVDHPGIHIDSRDIPRKNPRAIAMPVRIPEDIRVSIKPVGGASDYIAMFHEMGHALHYAYSEGSEFALMHLGDSTTTEAFAFLFDNLAHHPLWLKDTLGIPEPALSDYLHLATFKKLYMVRRYAAKVLFELEAHGPLPPRDLKKAYAKYLSLAYGFALGDGAERYLMDHDDFFYSASYLRAWALEAQLSATLMARFGERWWQNPQAGEYLVQLWKTGQRLSGEALAGSIQDANASEFGTLDPGPLLRRAARHLARMHPGLVAEPVAINSANDASLHP